MAKSTKKQNKINVENLSERDRDVLSLDTPAVMKKYKIEKQAVYDRRFALNKKIKAAGLSVDQLLNRADGPATEAPGAAPKKRQPKKTNAKKAAPEKVETAAQENVSGNRELMVVDKQVPVIMKPIEINFENFSIKLNGVPKKIAVNPDTNAIEIDL